MAVARLLIRLTFLLLVLGATTAITLLLLLMDRLTGRRHNRSPLARACFLACCRCLGIRITERGSPPEGPVLLLSNHISWTDIPVLGGLMEIRFLSKAEVADWPLVGWLARQAGTLFIRRGSGEAAQRREDITRTLQAGQSVLVFPEGTTSSGLTVLPFFPRLIGAATAAEVPVVPVSIAYLREGEPCHVAPFIGDDEFHHHLLRLLSARAPEVRVTWHPPMTAAAGASARELSDRVREVILEGLRQSHHTPGVSGCPAATSSSVASRADMISRSK
ncbi:lysophospholipid acyltransferase family protein [Marinobacter sp.]|uniref:lysophospholipid acyltransferase family protein n=1 Tax=Marinobacter sp. TaxID=50741 RepID=UPI0035629BBD